MRLTAAVAGVLAAVVLSAVPAAAGTGDVVEAGADGSTQEINAKVSTATVSESPVISTCSWLVNPPISDVYPTVVRDVSTKTFDNESRTYRLYLKTCPGLPDEYIYIPDVSPREVIDQAALALRKKLPTPTLAMSPSATAGGIVNLGMWLAVQDAGEVSVTAQLGPIWATVRARQRGLRWDMGNGDVVSCAGVGTPIVDTSTPDAGPCGYFYRRSSAGLPGSVYTVTSTSVWAVSYTSSVGAGVLGDVPVSNSFGYRVRELQTIGVSP
jgi:hypothetical protein